MFDAAAQRVEESLKRIEATGRMRNVEFERAMRRVGDLATELSVMAAAGDRTAERLDRLIAAAREAAQALDAAQPIKTDRAA